MRHMISLLLGAAMLAGCVSTRQFADLQLIPPQGDYKLLVLRLAVSVASVTMGGMPEQRADWTEAARAAIVSALRTQWGARGGQLLIANRRSDGRGDDEADTVADFERPNAAVDQVIAAHKYLGDTLPTKRRTGLDDTLGQDPIDFGRKTGFDYMLFSTARTRSLRAGESRCRYSASPVVLDDIRQVEYVTQKGPVFDNLSFISKQRTAAARARSGHSRQRPPLPLPPRRRTLALFRR